MVNVQKQERIPNGDVLIIIPVGMLYMVRLRRYVQNDSVTFLGNASL